MQLTITEAAKLYGKQRKTLYRHMETGRLSYGVRGDGHKVIDFSEMLRVYGDPPGGMPSTDTEVTHHNHIDDTLTHALIDELRALRQEVKELREHMLRLPAPEPEKEREPDKPDDDPHGFRAAVQRMRN